MEPVLLECSMNALHLVCSHPPVAWKCSTDARPRFACRRCLRDQSDYLGTFACPCCRQEHALASVDVSDEARSLYEQSLNSGLVGLSRRLLDSADRQNSETKSALERRLDVRQTLANQLEFIEQEILLRVESLKSQLDEVGQCLSAKIDRFRSHHFGQIETLKHATRFASQDTKTFAEMNCAKRRLQAQVQKVLTHVEAISRDDYVPAKAGAAADSQAPRLRCLRPGNKKKTSDQLKATSVGYLTGPSVRSTSVRLKGLLEKLPAKSSPRSPVVETIDMRESFKSVCGLADLVEQEFYLDNAANGWTFKSSLLIGDYASDCIRRVRKHDSFQQVDLECVKVSDEKFKTNKFKKYYAFCTSLDDMDDAASSALTRSSLSANVYICDIELHRVLIFDLKLRRLKRILSGTASNVAEPESDRKIEFECPRDVCYARSHVFVLDQGVDCVDRFEHDGDFVCEYDLRGVGKLWSVRVSGETMAVIDWKKAVLLYKLDDARHQAVVLRSVIEQADVLSMCFLNRPGSCKQSLFTHAENGDFTCYEFDINEDDEDKKADKVLFRSNHNELKYRSEFMTYSSRQQFVISFGWAKTMALLNC